MSSAANSAQANSAAATAAGAGSAAPQPLNAGLFSVMLNGVASIQEQAYLVSKDGQKFSVHEDVLKASSVFFSSALENGMRETGKFSFSWDKKTAAIWIYHGARSPVLIVNPCCRNPRDRMWHRVSRSHSRDNRSHEMHQRTFPTRRRTARSDSDSRANVGGRGVRQASDDALGRHSLGAHGCKILKGC